MPQKPEQTKEREDLTPAKAGENFKSLLIDAFNRHLPDQAFDPNKDISMQLEDDGIKLKQMIETVEIPEGKTFSPGVKEKIYVFDPEDAARYFKKLDPEVQESYINGLNEAIETGERFVSEYRDALAAEDITETEKKELQKNIEDDEKEIGIKQKLIAELTK